MPRLFFFQILGLFSISTEIQSSPIPKLMRTPNFMHNMLPATGVNFYFRYTLCLEIPCVSQKYNYFMGVFCLIIEKKISFLLLQRNYKEGKLQFHELQKYVNVFSFLDTLRTNFEKFSTPYSLKHQFYLQFCL